MIGETRSNPASGHAQADDDASAAQATPPMPAPLEIG